jgi:hypothetical protein
MDAGTSGGDQPPLGAQGPRVLPGGMPLGEGAAGQAASRALVLDGITPSILTEFHRVLPTGKWSADGTRVEHSSIPEIKVSLPLAATGITPRINLADCLGTKKGKPCVVTAKLKLLVQALQAGGKVPAHMVPLLGAREKPPLDGPVREGAPDDASCPSQIGMGFYHVTRSNRGSNSDHQWGLPLRCAHNAPGLPMRK